MQNIGHPNSMHTVWEGKNGIFISDGLLILGFIFIKVNLEKLSEKWLINEFLFTWNIVDAISSLWEWETDALCKNAMYTCNISMY